MEGPSWIRSVKDWVGWREAGIGFSCFGSVILKLKVSLSPLLLLIAYYTLRASLRHASQQTHTQCVNEAGRGMMNIRNVSQRLHNCSVTATAGSHWAFTLRTCTWGPKMDTFYPHIHAAPLVSSFLSLCLHNISEWHFLAIILVHVM